jgi:hypothetical protein
LKTRSAWRDFDGLGVEVARRQTVGEHHRALLFAEFQQLAPVFIVKVKNSSARRIRPAAFEQHLLGVEVFFHRAVVIEMVTRKIREHGHIKRNSENTLLLERVR